MTESKNKWIVDLDQSNDIIFKKNEKLICQIPHSLLKQIQKKARQEVYDLMALENICFYDIEKLEFVNYKNSGKNDIE